MRSSTVVANSQQLGAHVRALRKARGLTQTDVARMLGVSKMRVATIEKDVGRVATATVLGLIQLLGGAVRLDLPDAGNEAPPSDALSKPNQIREVPRRGEW